jgi:hypothetical protein
VTILPLEYLRVPEFYLADWYAFKRAKMVGRENYQSLLIHDTPIEELLADAVQQYFNDVSRDLPMFAEVGINRVLREPEDLDSPDTFVISMPCGGHDLHEEISEVALLNPELNLVNWVLARQKKALLRETAHENGWGLTHRNNYLSSLFGDSEAGYKTELEFFCGGVQIPPDTYKGIARTASTPKIPQRVVAKPLVIVVLVNDQPVRALVDSGSLGDLISTTIADQLKLRRSELQEPITLQLAVQGSRSKINHTVDVRFKYQDIEEKHTFFVANLSGYDMILGTSWLLQHKVSVGLNPARVCIGSANALPLEGVATARIFANSTTLKADVLQAACEELMEYAKPICKTAAETGLPPLRAINHTIPLIDENKILAWRPSRCPEALRALWNEKRRAYLKAGRWKIANSGNTAPMLLLPKVKTNPPGLRVVVDL